MASGERSSRDRSKSDSSRTTRKHLNRADELREQLIRNQKLKQNGRKSRKKRKPSPNSTNELETKRRKTDLPSERMVGKNFTWRNDGKTERVILQSIKPETKQLELVVVNTQKKLSVPSKEFGRNLVLEKKPKNGESLGKRRLRTSVERSPLKKRKLSSPETKPNDDVEDEEEELEMSGTEEPASSPTPSDFSPLVSPPLPKQTQSQNWDPKIRGCRYLEDSYEFLNEIDEGAYGQVSRYRDKITGEIVALKRVKMEQSHHGFPKSSLREISCLLQLRHENIVTVKEAVVSKNHDRRVYMAMEFCQHDFRALMLTNKCPWSVSEIKCLMQQLLSGVSFMHEHYIFHRDLKTSNLLLTDDGYLKICDFGMARKFGSPIKRYTPLVVTLWYRAPEILLQEQPLYTQAVDVWSVGCIMAEFFLNTPVFDGAEEGAQIEKILDFLGTPSKEEWPEFHTFPKAQKLRKKYRKNYPNKLPLSGTAMANSNKNVLDDTGLDLLLKLLRWDPKQRITAKDALNHPWFKQQPQPAHRDFMPTFPSLNKEERKRALKRSRKEQEMLKRELEGGFHM